MATKFPKGVKRKDMAIVDPLKVAVQSGWNPRKKFGTDEDIEFKNFIFDNGPKFPAILVKQVDDEIRLVYGERRLRATIEAIEDGAEIAGIPAIFTEKNASEVDLLALAVAENQGKPLTATEEANAVKRLKDWGLDEEAIAKKIGKSPSHVRNRLTLAQASPAIIEAVESGTMTQGEAMKAVKDSEGNPEKQNEALEKMKKPSAGKAPKMMSRLKTGNEIEALQKAILESGIDPATLGDLDDVSVLVGLTMVMKNMSKEDAQADVFLMLNDAKAVAAVSDGKAPWAA